MNGHSRLPIHPALAEHVEGIWVQHDAPAVRAAPRTPPPQPYTVLPTPFPVVGFQYRGRLSVLRDGGLRLLGRGGITGLQSVARRFQGSHDTRSVLVVLKPHAPFTLFGCAAHELTDQHVSLDDLLPSRSARDVEERVADGNLLPSLGRVVESFLLDCLNRSQRVAHPAVIKGAKEILAACGSVPIESLASCLAISRRQLERLFVAQIGVAPKEFASLVRFDLGVREHPRRRSWSALAHDAGYADQAHFIRSFSRRAGMTPAQYARAARPPS